jgi:acyl-CoA reductase-like NAD-dependent aldehyde dehydrogenase
VYVATALSCVTITSLNLVSILRKVLATQAEQARRVAQETRARAAREMVENRRRVLERLAEEELQQAIDASLAQEQPSAPIVQASNPQITAVQNSCRTFLGNRSDQKNDECTLCNEITTVNLYPCKNIHTGYICAGCITNLHDKCALCRERLFTR